MQQLKDSQAMLVGREETSVYSVMNHHSQNLSGWRS